MMNLGSGLTDNFGLIATCV